MNFEFLKKIQIEMKMSIGQLKTSVESFTNKKMDPVQNKQTNKTSRDLGIEEK